MQAMQKAERFRTELLRRGVLIVPVIWGEGKEPQKVEKKGFGTAQKAATSLPSIGVTCEGFHKRQIKCYLSNNKQLHRLQYIIW